MSSLDVPGQTRRTPRFALFDVGFRPFFLAGAAWSAVALALWIAAMHGAIRLSGAYPGVVWHAHEMVYGFAAAIVSGFLLTAVPSWTGRPGLTGYPLAALAALWLAGRGAMLATDVLGVAPVAAIDLAFLTVVFALVAAQVIAGRNWRNLPVALGPGLLLTGNALVRAEPLGLSATADLGHRLGIAVIAMLVALIGGRILPAFTAVGVRCRLAWAAHSQSAGINACAVALQPILTAPEKWAYTALDPSDRSAGCRTFIQHCSHVFRPLFNTRSHSGRCGASLP
jgi:uncharacterized protein involved in response to NO